MKQANKKRSVQIWAFFFSQNVLGYAKTLSPQNARFLKAKSTHRQFWGEGINSINDLFHFPAFYVLLLQPSVAEVQGIFFQFFPPHHPSVTWVPQFIIMHMYTHQSNSAITTELIAHTLSFSVGVCGHVHKQWIGNGNSWIKGYAPPYVILSQVCLCSNILKSPSNTRTHKRAVCCWQAPPSASACRDTHLTHTSKRQPLELDLQHVSSCFWSDNLSQHGISPLQGGHWGAQRVERVKVSYKDNVSFTPLGRCKEWYLPKQKMRQE